MNEKQIVLTTKEATLMLQLLNAEISNFDEEDLGFNDTHKKDVCDLKLRIQKELQ